MTWMLDLRSTDDTDVGIDADAHVGILYLNALMYQYSTGLFSQSKAMDFLSEQITTINQTKCTAIMTHANINN